MTSLTPPRMIGLRLAWALLLLWTVVTTILPGTPSDELTTGAAALYILLALVHAGAGFGLGGAALLAGSSFLIAFAYECSSVHTGFPFGVYEHSAAMGFKLFGTPVLVAFGYFAIVYPAWMIARIVLDESEGRSAPVIAALVTALIATGMDAASDAIGATVHGLWAYGSPSGFFGVPLSNYLGWLLTTFSIGLALSLIARRLKPLPPLAMRAYWALPPLFWIVFALQFVLHPLIGRATHSADVVVQGAHRWLVADIYEASAMVALLTMVPVALIALAKLAGGLPLRQE